MTKSHPTVQASGASLSAGGAGAKEMARPIASASHTRVASRTIVETAACPPELKRADKPWRVMARRKCVMRQCAPLCQCPPLSHPLNWAAQAHPRLHTLTTDTPTPVS